MGVKSYKELIVWQKAIDLVEAVYRATLGFPREETYGLTSQIRRAVVSIPSNIAEGQGRNTRRDFVNFLCIARGSLKEVETQIIIAKRLAYLPHAEEVALIEQIAEVGRILNGLINSLTEKPQET
jgi:four helix bundle protein